MKADTKKHFFKTSESKSTLKDNTNSVQKTNLSSYRSDPEFWGCWFWEIREQSCARFDGHPVVWFHEDVNVNTQLWNARRCHGAYSQPHRAFPHAGSANTPTGGGPLTWASVPYDHGDPVMILFASTCFWLEIIKGLAGNNHLIFCFFAEFSWRWKGNSFTLSPGYPRIDHCLINLSAGTSSCADIPPKTAAGTGHDCFHTGTFALIKCSTTCHGLRSTTPFQVLGSSPVITHNHPWMCNACEPSVKVGGLGWIVICVAFHLSSFEQKQHLSNRNCRRIPSPHPHPIDQDDQWVCTSLSFLSQQNPFFDTQLSNTAMC